LIKTPELFRQWQSNLRALGELSTGRAAWDDLLAAIGDHARIATEQQAAAAHQDSETFTKDYHEGSKAQDRLVSAATAAGVTDCASVDH
jgi:hypothetical protein